MKSGVMRKGFTFCLAAIFFSLSACTPPAETTGVGAATGGLLGAGLGAIVGNQTGDPGAGLVIGALAGASAGAMVGNAIQAQQEIMRTQDEAIERQEKMIMAQRSEIQDLRRVHGDATSFSSGSLQRKPVEGTAGGTAKREAATPSAKTTIPEPVDQKSGELFRFDSSNDPDARASLDWGKENSVKVDSSGLTERNLSPDIKPQFQPAASGSANTENKVTGQCREGFSEAMLAKKETDPSKKLLHYRKALRLCPDEAAFHYGLGQVYLSLNRKADARNEFKEAERLDPVIMRARADINSLSSGSAAPTSVEPVKSTSAVKKNTMLRNKY